VTGINLPPQSAALIACCCECGASAGNGESVPSVNIMERTYEERAQALHCSGESSHSEAALLDKVPVSDLCEELSLKPTVFYRWQKEFFENGAAAFQAQERPHRQVEEKQKRIEFLEKKVQTKNEVLAELMAEHVALKKHLGNSNRQLGTA